MSSNIPDTDEIKAKYAEIASLKKAIHEKQMQQRSFDSSSHPAVSSFRGRGRGGYRARYSPYSTSARGRGTNHRNLTLVFNGGDINNHTRSDVQESTSSVIETSCQQEPRYVSSVSKSGMSLVHSDLYEQDKTKFIEQNQQATKLKNKVIEQRLISRDREMISKNKVKFDNCDRIEINNNKYAVAKNGTKLVPISIPVLRSVEKLNWMNRSYSSKKNGTFKMVGRKAKYVTISAFVLSLIRY